MLVQQIIHRIVFLSFLYIKNYYHVRLYRLFWWHLAVRTLPYTSHNSLKSCFTQTSSQACLHRVHKMNYSTWRMFCETFILSCFLISLSLSSVSCCVRCYNMSMLHMCNATLNSFLCKEAMPVLYHSHTSHLTQRETPCVFCLLSWFHFPNLCERLKSKVMWSLKWQRQHKNPHCFECCRLHPLIFFHITHLPDIFVLSCLHLSFFHPILTTWSSSLFPSSSWLSSFPPLNE